jgi:hypothetical protein
MTAVRAQADPDHAGSEGKVIDATGNHGEWKKCTATYRVAVAPGAREAV